MSKKIQNIRGTFDLSPEDTRQWQKLEALLHGHAQSFGYGEIRFPILESTELFARSSGESSDIVSKEMYTFRDRNDQPVSLRPEGTAPAIRAGIQRGWLHNQLQRFYYLGPMFRRERPQKGRYRQFHQFGLEAFGMDGPSIEIEMLIFAHTLWQKLALKNIRLEINHIGDASIREDYSKALHAYFSNFDLDEESVQQLEKNPMRLLDSKKAEIKALSANAPKLESYLTDEMKQAFQNLQSTLISCGIPFTVNPTMVRGLDYYNGLVFEWITDSLGAQGTFCAGGRYDALVGQLGGSSTYGIGCALGMERLLELATLKDDATDAYALLIHGPVEKCWPLWQTLKKAFPNHALHVHGKQASQKAVEKYANKKNYHALIGCHEGYQFTQLRPEYAHATFDAIEKLLDHMSNG